MYSGIAYADFTENSKTKLPQIVITYYKNDKKNLAGEARLDISANTINSTIVAIKFNEFNPMRKDDREEVILGSPNQGQ